MSSSDTAPVCWAASSARLLEHATADLGATRWGIVEQSMGGVGPDLTDGHTPSMSSPTSPPAHRSAETITPRDLWTLSLQAPTVDELLNS